MNIFKKIFLILKHPEEFFINLKETKIRTAVFYYLVICIIPIVFSFIGNSLWPVSQPALYIAVRDFISLFTLAIVIPAFYPGVLIFGKKEITKLYQAYLYGFTSSVLFSWQPYLALIAVFYSVYSTITGIKFLYNLKTWKAAAAFLLPPLIYTTLFIIIITILGFRIAFI